MGKLSLEQQAIIILKGLDKYIQVDWNVKDFYVKGVVDGLKTLKETNNNE